MCSTGSGGSPARCDSRPDGSRRWPARSRGWVRGPCVATRPCAPRPFGRCSTATGTTARGRRGSSASATRRSRRRCDARSSGARNEASSRPRASGGRARRMARQHQCDEGKTAGTGGDRAMEERPDRNIALELVRVTEAAALAAGRWVGRGDKLAADQAAVDAMRLMIDTVSMDGVVVIGEGEKDEAPMLYNGESVGTGEGPACDVAVDPIDGTRLTALGQPNALAERGSMFFPGAAVYMEKVATGPEAADAIDITASPEENVRLVAKAKGIRPEEVGVVILDRDRHAEMIARVREVGARVHLI